MTNNIKKLFLLNNFIPKKKFGQNFLLNEDLARRIVERSGLNRNDKVLEVGSGFGILTKNILNYSKNLTVIEIDKKLSKFLEKNYQKLKVLNEDATKTIFPVFDYFFGNLPFNISSKIIMKISNKEFKKAIIMVQKEFANRMIAECNSKNYSKISVATFFYFDCKVLFEVKSSNFYPIPKVDSIVLELIPKKNPFEPLDIKFYFEIVSLLFSHRRKKIGSVLNKCFDLKTKFEKIYFFDKRVGELSPEQISDISNFIFLNKKEGKII